MTTMERPKSEFSSAYKMTTCIVDKKGLRVRRRSMEQKQMRRELANKNRNIDTLSPLEEDDVSVNKSYKEKTPVKRDEKTGQNGRKIDNRKMQMLKWKEERMKAKKLEIAKKKPVFKISGSLEREELAFSKPTNSKHASKTSEKTRVFMPATAVQEKKKGNGIKPLEKSNVSMHVTAVPEKKRGKEAKPLEKTKVLIPVTTVREKKKIDETKDAVSKTTRNQGSGAMPPPNKAHPTRAVSDYFIILLNKPIATFTSSASRGKEKETYPARTTRQSAAKKDTAKSMPEVCEDKVTTTRGGGEISFAPEDFAFTAPSSITSYIFQPLSPASAAQFLYPTQDSCVSFYDSAPGRKSQTETCMQQLEKQSSSGRVTRSMRLTSVEETSNYDSDPCERNHSNKELDKKNRRVSRSSKNVGHIEGEESIQMDHVKERKTVIFKTPEKKTSDFDEKRETETINISHKKESVSETKERDCVATDMIDDLPSVSSVERVELSQVTKQEHKNTLLKTESQKRVTRRSVAVMEAEFASKKSSHKRRKTHLQNVSKSPEEWVELLRQSPMVEMTRRTPRRNVIVPPLNFDDIDLDESLTITAEVPESDGMTIFTAPQSLEPVECVLTQSMEPESTVTSTNVDTQNSLIAGSLDGEHDVKYFRNLLVHHTERLTQLCDKWTEPMESTQGLDEDVKGQIRTVVGQAQLLMRQRFKQFTGLVDNCEFGLGEKETTCMDLQGFWDMIYFQVEDVDIKFEELSTLQKNNWVIKSDKPVEKVPKKKPAQVSNPKPKTNAKSKFAAFRAQIKKQIQSDDLTFPVATVPSSDAAINVFDAGFFKVISPVRTPKPHCEAGTPKSKLSEKYSVLPQSQEYLTPALLRQTPLRKSYLPAVPSPLLQDTTPQRQSKGRSSIRKATKLKSLRTRRSVTFMDDTSKQDQKNNSLVCELKNGSDPFLRYLQPTKCNKVELNVNDDSFSKYLKPSNIMDTSLPFSSPEEEKSPVKRKISPSQEASSAKKSRLSSVHKSSLKTIPSAAKLRTRRSVRFSLSADEEDKSLFKLPTTPYLTHRSVHIIIINSCTVAPLLNVPPEQRPPYLKKKSSRVPDSLEKSCDNTL
ncbi:hypothetical protein ACJMK2_040680 [Sinanodonta woodiana]|uniref:Disks large-associated protein 5 n=1 Tax=Sinanodonta woodiana TaxID=1069815 RepID=A0ABD3W1T3_SINWO